MGLLTQKARVGQGSECFGAGVQKTFVFKIPVRLPNYAARPCRGTCNQPGVMHNFPDRFKNVGCCRTSFAGVVSLIVVAPESLIMLSSNIVVFIAVALMLGLVIQRRFFTPKDYSLINAFPGPDASALLVLVAAVMQVIVTMIVLCAGLYVILEPSYHADDKKWGYSIVGTVVGYWLKGVAK